MKAKRINPDECEYDYVVEALETIEMHAETDVDSLIDYAAETDLELDWAIEQYRAAFSRYLHTKLSKT